MALDLNKLESKLDDALDKETTESLNNWIEDKQTPMIKQLRDHLDSTTPEQFQKEIEEIEIELRVPPEPNHANLILDFKLNPTTCEMEDCPHCAYERQQQYEYELEKDACVDFGNWLLFQNPTYVDNTDEGNIYMVESNMNRRMTMEQIYQLYLKS